LRQLLAVVAMLPCMALADGSWQADKLDWRTSPVDLSFLNASEKPAGKRGFLRARQDRLVFEDGTVARFWGTNLTAAALFGTTPENTKRQARRLSELGFNLVRIHHHDSEWVKPNIFGLPGDRARPDLDPAMLDKLDRWIKCLKDEGIYVWLDLHVGRRIQAGEAIAGLEEILRDESGASVKGYAYVNDDIRATMKRFNEAYVNHQNGHTGLSYKDEPAIVAMLLTNENDVTGHFGNALLPGKGVPQHSSVYMKAAASFAATSGLPESATWRSWEPGPSKLFLNDLEWRFSVDLIADLRRSGVKVPLVTTSTWGENAVSSLPALTAGEIIDAHAYGGNGELKRNPLKAANMVHWLAAAQIAGRPLSVTEWNVERFPVPDRHAVPMYIAASASHQGWDAMMQYAYAQVPLNEQGRASNWHAFNDPALIATLPAAALLFRRGDVTEASSVYAFAPSPAQLFGQSISPANAIALRTAAERGRLVLVLPATKALPWLEAGALPANASRITDPALSLVAANATEVVSDSGNLRRNWELGIFTIDTPRSQAAMGAIGGRNIRLQDVRVAAGTANATVAVQSLDDMPISRSRNILVSVGAGAIPGPTGDGAFISERVKGLVSIKAVSGLRLYRGGRGTPRLEIPVTYSRGRYELRLERAMAAHFLLQKPALGRPLQRLSVPGPAANVR
jgi:hypothetical protein